MSITIKPTMNESSANTISLLDSPVMMHVVATIKPRIVEKA